MRILCKKKALIHGGASIKNSGINSAKDYGSWLIENGFTPVPGAEAQKEGISYSVLGQQKCDVVIIERLKNPKNARSIHGHMAMFDGKHWVSDFVQQRGFYPNQEYRDESTPFVLYRYAGNQPADEKKEEKTGAKLIKIVYPIPKNERGQEFSNLDDIMAHLNGESTGSYLLGRNGMWHSGIHITNATTPWCALSAKKFEERSVFAGAYTGEQSIRCMADGEIIAYRINKEYQTIPWKNFILQLSASFVLVRHTLQLGDSERSRLRFYTLYMHLAPHSAYQKEETTPVWKLQNTLNAYPAVWREQPKTPRSTTLAKGSLVEWSPEKSETKLTITKKNQSREYGLVTVKSNEGSRQQVWILVDNNNIARHDENDITPSWWKGFRLAPAQDVMEFDKVVSLNTPIAIKAGDSIGHMGFYQAPKEQGIESRYQVHIECISHDDNLPQFLKNPDAVGINDPYYLKCLPGLMLWEKKGENEFVKTERITKWESLHKLSELKIETDKQQQKYYFLPEHLGYFPKQIDISDTDKDKIGSLIKRVEEIQADETKQAEYQNITRLALFLSRYDLEKIGFRALTSETKTFDYLNGYIQPKATYISAIFDTILAEAKVSPRPEKGIIAHNYQRLINKIKGSATEHYNPEEYRRAFHNPMFSHIVNKTIVKHPSDWYYKKNDSVWQNFLNMLSEEAPLWRSYSEEFLDGMVWMQDVTSEKLGPEVWHMHPLVFLDSFHSKKYDFSTKEGTIHAIISECKNQGISLNTQIAYILATVKRETGDAFQPVREGNYGGRTVSDEYRKKKFRYYPYYGRGYVQITWKYNYEKYSQKLNVDMVNEPDLALNPEYSLFILIDGFKYGEFTGKKITDYINESKTDFYNARKCINGLDQADQIKGFAEDYLEKLNNGLLA
ncbi:glycoside hydrolase family 19 protein [Providencia stuartii]|uniref:glycoside hydrolase family 19 protein n=2 Tax=Providencia stuartii TaxID=588 RepID=UPI00197EA7D6|nr:glycoside hydrolase family 19 protein [Providencia stuartii]MBN5600256.1 hypothetical protein [Providencia stuartii]MBN5604128.1 hypothetical protein [Providencia stuartii]